MCQAIFWALGTPRAQAGKLLCGIFPPMQPTIDILISKTLLRGLYKAERGSWINLFCEFRIFIKIEEFANSNSSNSKETYSSILNIINVSLILSYTMFS